MFISHHCTIFCFPMHCLSCLSCPISHPIFLSRNTVGQFVGSKLVWRRSFNCRDWICYGRMTGEMAWIWKKTTVAVLLSLLIYLFIHKRTMSGDWTAKHLELNLSQILHGLSWNWTQVRIEKPASWLKETRAKKFGQRVQRSTAWC
jgi:hypothetical protein